MEWARRYMKQDFAKVLFTNEIQATLDGPDGWAKDGRSTPRKLLRDCGDSKEVAVS